MERMIPVERLAREDRMVLMRARKAREIREEQNLDARVMPFDEEALRARMHGIFCGEVQAMKAAGRTLFDFPDAPWEFQLDMARQVWDESRHAEIFEGLLAYMGAEPVTTSRPKCYGAAHRRRIRRRASRVSIAD
jgi:hypothetical protein